jgi:hypothetical protein
MARRLALWVGLGAAMAAVAIAAVLAFPGAQEHVAKPAHDGGARTPATPGSQAPGTAGDAARLVADAQAEVAAGRLLPAHGLYERAYALDPSASTLLELAVVEHRMGRCREARRTALRVLAGSPDRALADRAQQLLAAIGRCD